MSTEPRLNCAPHTGVARRLAALLAALPLAACQSVVLDPKGPVGTAENSILYGALAVMLTIVVPVIVAALAFAWWFRASNTRAKYRPDWAYSGQIELVTWSIPALVILLLGGVIWIGSHQLDPMVPLKSRNRPLEVQVVSLDWKWLFIYPEQGIASVNILVVPAATPVHFSLTSASVMSAFFVPQLGSMIYTMNGMSTQLNLMAYRPGVFEGRSSHYNGDGFSGMHFQMRAVAPEQFAAWVAAARGAGTALDAASYRALTRQTSEVRPFTYASATPGLYRAIVLQQLPPAAGPKPAVSPRSEASDAAR